ncbi:hypothetical protein Dimus_000920, partial [Dionaea muscipula]
MEKSSDGVFIIFIRSAARRSASSDRPPSSPPPSSRSRAEEKESSPRSPRTEADRPRGARHADHATGSPLLSPSRVAIATGQRPAASTGPAAREESSSPPLHHRDLHHRCARLRSSRHSPSHQRPRRSYPPPHHHRRRPAKVAVYLPHHRSSRVGSPAKPSCSIIIV